MTYLELLAPARDCNIGIAAIDCGADAVYIAGPKFGARQAAGNEIGASDLALIKGKHGKKLYIFIGKNLFYHDLPPNF